MSYNGELSNKPTKIDIPAVSTTDGYTTFTLNAGSGVSPGKPFWITENRIYTYDFNGNISYSHLDDPANSFIPGYSFNNGNTGIVPSFGYPFPVDGYLLAMSNSIDSSLGSPSGGVFRSLSGNWPSFANSIATLATPVHNAMVYVDATYIWVFGGLTAMSTATNTIQRCTRANPTVWNNVGTMPINRANAALAVVGSSIYMYGGLNESGVATNTVYTATVADPTTWTNTGNTLPTTTYNGAIYQDGTNVYLFGAVGPTVSNDILRATLAAPSSMTKVGTMSIGSSVYTYARNGDIYSIGNASFNNVSSTYVEKATVASPLSWAPLANGLSKAVHSAATIVHNGSVYVIGGNSDTGDVNNVQRASFTQPLNFSSVGTIPSAFANMQVVKTSTKAYLLGVGTAGIAYEAPLTNLSTGWTLSSAAGPGRYGGKVFTYKNYIFYLGGETNTTTSSSNVGRAVVEGGSIVSWVWQGSARFQSSNFPSLSRFALIVAGDYIYVFGGHTNGTANTGLYRARISHLVKASTTNTTFAWNKIGAITSVIDPVIVTINNRVFVMGGSVSSITGTPQRTILSGSMQDLANGWVNFNYEGISDATSPTPLKMYPFTTSGSEAGGDGIANSMPVCIKNNIYFYDCRTATGINRQPYKTHNHSKYTLVGNNGISNGVPQVVVADDGTLGSVSYFQKNGMLPWHVSEY